MESTNEANEISNNIEKVVESRENSDIFSEEQTVLLSDNCDRVLTAEKNTVVVREVEEVNATEQNTLDPSVDNVATRCHSTQDSDNENEEQTTLLNIEDVSVILPSVDGDAVLVDQCNAEEPSVHVSGNTEELFNQETGTNSLTNRTFKINTFFSVLFQKISFVLAAVFGLADVATDLLLVYQYYANGQYWYCGLTGLFIWLPSLMGTYTLYKLCEHEDQDKWFVEKTWPWLFIFIFQMSSAVFALKHALVFKHFNRKEYVEKQKQLLQLQLIDIFNEAAPQATLQLYSLYYSKNENSWQYYSMFFSWFTIARVATTHSFNFSTFNRRKICIQLPVFTYIFLFNILIIASRIATICMSFYGSTTVTTCCVVIHFVLCYIGLGCLKMKLPDRQLLTHWFTFPAVSMFNVFDINDMSIFGYRIISILRVYLLYYALFLLEYILFISTYFNYLNIESISLQTLNIICVIGLLYSIYYRLVIYKSRTTLPEI